MQGFRFFVFLIRKNVRMLDTTKAMLTFIEQNIILYDSLF